MSDYHFWKDRKVLITGLTGFIGSWLAERLVQYGADVIGYDLDLHHALDLHPGLREKIALERGDILDTRALASILTKRRIDTCFHLAGQSLIERGLEDPVRTFEINTRGTWTALEACRKAGVNRVVASSSNTVYGPQTKYPFEEDAALNGAHPYAASKAAADIAARSFAKTFGLPAVVCRQTNTFGGADPHRTHIVPSTIFSLLKNEPPIIKSDGTPTKAYLFVDDTVDGYLALAERADDPLVSGQAFNITAEEPVSVLELVNALIRVSGKNLRPDVVGTPETTRKEHEHLSTQKTKELVGWRAKHTLEQGLAKTFKWYGDNLDFYNRILEMRV